MVVGEFTQEAQLVIIGGGPGGYSAAFRAAELGIQTVIVDSRDALGGTCLHQGCIPSKTLLSIGRGIHAARAASQWGVHFDPPRVDVPAIQQWTRQTIGKLADGLESLCRKHGVERIQGRAEFEDSRHLSIVDGPISRIKFKRALIATGARPISPAFASPAGNRILTPAAALEFQDIPKSLVVVGSDYMAVELASIYADLGTAVTVLVPDERLLPEADSDLVRVLARCLKERVKDIVLGVRFDSIQEKASGVTVQVKGSEPDSSTYERAIISAGQQASTDNLGLDHTQVQFDEAGFIRVDAQLRTADPRILAVGDVTGAPMLAHRAIHQGRVAAEQVAGLNSAFDPRAIPMVVFTDPDVAWCGLTEAEAAAQSTPFAVSRISWGASGRAVGLGRTEGLTKVIHDLQTGLVLGVRIVGHGAAEMISEACMAIELGAVVDDLAATIHPHPTMSELLGEAARAARGRSAPSTDRG